MSTKRSVGRSAVAHENDRPAATQQNDRSAATQENYRFAVTHKVDRFAAGFTFYPLHVLVVGTCSQAPV